MASKIEIASDACLLLGANQISSFSESTEGRIASALYEDTYRGILSSFRWRFASKKAMLSRLTEAPLNQYDYQYQLPTDLINLIHGETLDNYEIYGDKLYSNLPTVSIDYIYRVEETLLPSYFILCFKFLLAAQFAIPLTDNSTKAELYSGLYTTQYRIAKNIDSSQRPSTAILDKPLLNL